MVDLQKVGGELVVPSNPNWLLDFFLVLAPEEKVNKELFLALAERSDLDELRDKIRDGEWVLKYRLDRVKRMRSPYKGKLQNPKRPVFMLRKKDLMVKLEQALEQSRSAGTACSTAKLVVIGRKNVEGV